MKNADLIIKGRAASCFMPEFCNNPDELMEFEYDAYDAYDRKYGKDACEDAGIYDLKDLFGKEFSDRVYTRRCVLIARRKIGELRGDRAKIDESIQRLEEFLKNPTPDLERVLP